MAESSPAPRWLLALESSTPNGGAALLRDGEIVDIARLDEGLRHGRELMPAAAGLLERRGMAPRDLWAVAVSRGPGSYTGTRVGVMSAKALAFGLGCRLGAVSSLAALASSQEVEGLAKDGELVMVIQDARRDEVYAGLYRLRGGDAETVMPDAAMAPEEARDCLAECLRQGENVRLAGSGFATYAGLFASFGGDRAAPGAINPGAVGLLAWRQLLRDVSADPLVLQPEYLRRDAGHDWRHDILIQ